ncbi:MAG: sugar transporter [Verrucomicrobiales bacterium]|nr:sugar transporter [Verrucomicrobiales bacterium]
MKNLLIACLALFAAFSFAPGALAQNRAEHVLGPNDSIDVKVFQEPELDTKVTVSQDGKVSLPLIGEVAVGGQTISEASRLIATRYKQGYLVNPNVTVAMGEYAKRRFTILGAVNKPGAFFFPPGEGVSLLQAVGMAGGYSRIANASKITIKRGDAGQPIKLDAKKMAKSGEASSYMIKPGDVIEVGESWF